MKKYGLVGYPLGHSFSMNFFNEKFKNENIDAVYSNFEINDISLFPEIIEKNPELAGLNVTIPYKEKIISYLDKLDEHAQAIGAVNVIQVKRENGKIQLKGYNSDYIGFGKSISPLLEEHHKKALVLGTGGASKAVIYALKNLGIETQYVSRTGNKDVLSYNQIDKNIMEEFTVIVNCTPLGMYPNTDNCPSIPYEYITPKHVLYDLVYNPEETLFLKKGKEHGAITKNGLEMLILQAYAGWDFWNNNNSQLL